jgi:hypothetical protein
MTEIFPIPVGNRWAHLQHKAGMLLNAGLDKTGIYNGLKEFVTTKCEDGVNYPDEKLRALAEWAVDLTNYPIEPEDAIDPDDLMRARIRSMFRRFEKLPKKFFMKFKSISENEYVFKRVWLGLLEDGIVVWAGRSDRGVSRFEWRD